MSQDNVLTQLLAQEELQTLGAPIKAKRDAVLAKMEQAKLEVIEAATEYAAFRALLNGPNDITAADAAFAAMVDSVQVDLNAQEWTNRQWIKAFIDGLAVDGES